MPVTAMKTDYALIETRTVLLEVVRADPSGQDDGTLFAGDALRLMGKAALAVARGYTNGKVMMVRTDDVCFHQPLPIGHLLDLTARLIHVNGAVMTILVDGMMQSPTSGRRTLALSGYFQMIAVT